MSKGAGERLEDRPAHVVLDQRERGWSARCGDVGAPAGEEVVDGDDLVAAGEERVAQVRADEAGAAGRRTTAHVSRPTPWYVKPARPATPVEQVAGVDDVAAEPSPRRPCRVEPAELVPLGEHGEHVGAVAGRVGSLTDVDAVGSGPRHGRVVGLHRGAAGPQPAR